jgi:two-component system, NarL family, invasion response regulator UvrY
MSNEFDARDLNEDEDGNDHGHKISVMLVDDDPTFLRVTQMMLQKHHGDEINVVGTAKSGEECLTLAQLLLPEVVLMDLHMPGVGGLGTIPLLHILFPETRVIALTSDDWEGTQRLVSAAGGQGLISKSALQTDLFPAIQRTMKEDCATGYLTCY